MPSEKLRRILLAKSPLSPQEIEAITEADGWSWVYEHRPAPKPRKASICFTGFSDIEKPAVAQLAENIGLTVVGTVNKSLLVLCAGANPGPAKLAKAREQGTPIISYAQFSAFLETGEIQDWSD